MRHKFNNFISFRLMICKIKIFILIWFMWAENYYLPPLFESFYLKSVSVHLFPIEIIHTKITDHSFSVSHMKNYIFVLLLIFDLFQVSFCSTQRWRTILFIFPLNFLYFLSFSNFGSFFWQEIKLIKFSNQHTGNTPITHQHTDNTSITHRQHINILTTHR